MLLRGDKGMVLLSVLMCAHFFLAGWSSDTNTELSFSANSSVVDFCVRTEISWTRHNGNKVRLGYNHSSSLFYDEDNATNVFHYSSFCTFPEYFHFNLLTL